MIWGEVYPKEIYKFAWDIADLISSGRRPGAIEQIENEKMKNLIEKSWTQEPKERITISEIVEILENEYKLCEKKE